MYLYKVCRTKCFDGKYVGASAFVKNVGTKFLSEKNCTYVGTSVSMEKYVGTSVLYKVCRTKCFYEKYVGTFVFRTKSVGPSVSMTNL